MSKAYHITQWDDLYETSETRKIRALTFYGKPNKLIGEGIGLTLQEPDGLQLLGTWSLLADLASLSSREHRGWLIRNNSALTAARMAALVRVDVKHFERALDWFCRPEVGWLEHKETAAVTADSPANLPPRGKSPADSPANLPQEEREREKERGEIDRRERETPTSAAARASAIPSDEEVMSWARSSAENVDPDFALLKVRQAGERGDFAKSGWKAGGWRKKLARFWEEDGETWTRKNQKNRAPANGAPAGRPDGWKHEDQDFWWTDDLSTVRAAMSGAAQMNKKTAARIGEVIKLREGRK